ncbi:hypothetical protein C8F01DRAFT_1100751 [Mycena amicta]|nr:hypothetical protein C8F01DRAFT_1100751 [Mycena amicta]
MFHVAFIPIVAVFSSIGVFLGRKALIDPPMGPLVQGYRDSCTGYSPTSPFYDFICVIEPFFKELVTNELGKGLLTLFGTAGGVMSLHFYLRAGQPGRSIFFSPLIFTANSLAGQLFGAGIVSPIVVPTVFALAKTFSAEKRVLPPPAYSYTLTVILLQFCVVLLSTGLTVIPTVHPNWVYANYAFQGFPLIFLPLFFLSTSSSSRALGNTPTLSASAFRVLKFLHFFSWWGTAIKFGLTLREGSVPFTLPVYFMALDYAGFLSTFVGVYLVELVAGDVPAGFDLVKLVGRLLTTGPASTMAAYFEASERESIKFAAAAGLKKGK